MAVKSKLGISMLSRLALNREIETGEVVILDVEGFPFIDSWHLAYLKGNSLSRVAEAFLNFAIEHREQYAKKLLSQ